MSQFTLYHNPRCSKSRAALELLQSRGIEPEIIHYLDTPPTVAELQALLGKLGMQPRELMRTGEEVYKENNLDNPELSEAQLIDAMVQHPRLIERPVLADATRAVIGRPTENLLELLG